MRGRTVVSKVTGSLNLLQAYPELPAALTIKSGFSSGQTHRSSHSAHAPRGPQSSLGLLITCVLPAGMPPGAAPLLAFASALSPPLDHSSLSSALSPSCCKVEVPKSPACHFPTLFVSPPQSRAVTILLPLQCSWENLLLSFILLVLLHCPSGNGFPA